MKSVDGDGLKDCTTFDYKENFPIKKNSLKIRRHLNQQSVLDFESQLANLFSEMSLQT